MANSNGGEQWDAGAETRAKSQDRKAQIERPWQRCSRETEAAERQQSGRDSRDSRDGEGEQRDSRDGEGNWTAYASSSLQASE